MTVVVGGYVAADIGLLVSESMKFLTSSHIVGQDTAISDMLINSEVISGSASTVTGQGKVLFEAMMAATKLVPPSCLRGVAVQVPNVCSSC